MAVQLRDYGRSITNEDVGNRVLSDIKTALKTSDVVDVDFAGIASMTTSCAKQVFGTLYADMGPEAFFSRLVLKNASEDLRIVINNGIKSAIEDLDEGE